MNKGGLYFHIPFCIRKCAYCDFCSFSNVKEEVKHRYVDAMITEMESYTYKAKNLAFDTLFFGGGTPSLLPVKELERLLDATYRLFKIEKAAEITLEANPASADGEKLAEMRRLGVNRLSIGIQSLSDTELSFLGRVHNAADALRFYAMAEGAGFANINVDLMYGIPHQTVASFAETVKGVLTLSPAHISAYSLILEEGTPLFQQRDMLSFPTEEEEVAADTLLKEALASHGYRHYEISNYAKEGCLCRHNLHYWHSDEYLGFGSSAYSYFDGERYGNGRSLDSYIRSPLTQVAEREKIDQKTEAEEWFMLRFRLAEGVPLAAYEKNFGVNVEKRYGSLIQKYQELGLMKKSDTHLFLTEKGMRLSNAIIVDFLG